MVLYIHGFASSGEGAKARMFREHYRKSGIEFLAPSMSFIPELAVNTLEEIIRNCSDVSLLALLWVGIMHFFLQKSSISKQSSSTPPLHRTKP